MTSGEFLKNLRNTLYLIRVECKYSSELVSNDYVDFTLYLIRVECKLNFLKVYPLMI